MKHMQLSDIGRKAASPETFQGTKGRELEDSVTSFEPGRYGNSCASDKSVALTLTLAIHALVVCGFIVQWGVSHVTREVPALTVFNVAPPAAPPEPIMEVPPGPEQVEKEKPKPEPLEQDIEPPHVQLVSDNPTSVSRPQPDPGPPVEKTTAPVRKPAPPAAKTSNVDVSWEAKLLAHLEKFRRYPASAKARREQGVAYIRFTMDKQGKLISAQLSRSSGSQRLDKAALATIRRAAPFPKPPQDLPGDRIEITAPVEFFMR